MKSRHSCSPPVQKMRSLGPVLEVLPAEAGLAALHSIFDKVAASGGPTRWRIDDLQALSGLVSHAVVTKDWVARDTTAIVDRIHITLLVPVLDLQSGGATEESLFEIKKIVLSLAAECAAANSKDYLPKLLELIQGTLISRIQREMNRDEETDAEQNLHKGLGSVDFLSSKGVTLADRPTLNYDVLSTLKLAGHVIKLLSGATAVVDVDLQKLFASFLCLLTSSSAPQLRSIIRNDIIPVILKMRANMKSSESPLQTLWGRISLLSVMDAPQAREIPALLCRLFDDFFSDQSDIDLRKSDAFWKVIQSSMVGRASDAESVNSKYAIFLLKRVVDVSKKFRPIDVERPWTRYFTWSKEHTKDICNLYDDYCAYLETLYDSSPHLVQPIIPKLKTLLQPRQPGSPVYLHSSWFTVLLTRGMHNHIQAIRKLVLQLILDAHDPEILAAICSEWNFVSAELFPCLDHPSLYIIPGLGNFISPFGQGVRGFIPKLIVGFQDHEDKSRFIKFLCRTFRTQTSRIAALHIMHGLLDAARDLKRIDTALRPICANQLADIVGALSSANSISTWTTQDSKLLIRRILSGILLRFTDLMRVSYDDLISVVHILHADHEDVKQALRDLLKESVGLEQYLKSRVDKFVSTPEELSRQALTNAAEVLAAVLIFFPAARGPLDSRLARLYSGSLHAPLRTQLHSIALAHAVVKYGGTLVKSDELMQGCERWGVWSCFEDVDDCVAIFEQVGVKDGKLFTSIWDKAWIILRDSGVHQKSFTGQLDVYAALRLIALAARIASEGQFWSLRCRVEEIGVIVGLRFVRVVDDQKRNFNWSDLIAHFQTGHFAALLQLVKYIAGSPHSDEVSLRLAFTFAMDELRDVSFDSGPTVLNCISSMFDAGVVPTSADVVKLVNDSLAVCEENWENASLFWVVAEAVPSVVFHPVVLSNDSDPETFEAVEKFFKTFCDWSASKTFIVPTAASVALKYWRRTVKPDLDATAFESMNRHRAMFIQMLLWGPLWGPMKDEKRMDAAVSVEVRGGIIDDDIERTAEMNFSQKDYVVRVRANDILARLDLADPQQNRYALSVLADLLNVHNSRELSSVFPSSIEHRRHTRLWCSIHLIMHHIKTENVADWIERFLDAAESEMIVSTRYYVEWALARLFFQSQACLPRLYKRIHDSNKANCVSSFIAVSSMLSHTLSPHSSPNFYIDILPPLVTRATSNHFTIRLHAHLAIHRIWSACESAPEISAAIDASPAGDIARWLESHSEAEKYRKKADAIYFLTPKFDAVGDVTIGFIFRGGLTVCGVPEEERISSRAFQRVDPSEGRFVPLHHDPARAALWSQMDADMEALAEATVEDDVGLSSADENALAPLQKKILPWEAMMMTDIDLSMTRGVDTKRTRNSLIIVASLVEKPPNLGGLCRTCEIFNAELLVLGNLKLKDDIRFQTTAVTSDKWMPMIEVTPQSLPSYLRSKKEEGFALLGIEQATTSVSLERFTFPVKSILLLGEEKQGIPATLLPLLDHIVEIPQFGVIRSLNVHVSGALMVWEYTRQMELRK